LFLSALSATGAIMAPRPARIALLALVLVLPATARADHPELARMAQADQDERAADEGGWDDDARRRRVLELLAQGRVETARDRLHAALILQHTPGTICEGRLRSSNPENYLLAHHLAQAALDAGLDEARYLVAASIDRYLAFTEGRQRYGTNRLVDLETGESYLPEIDRSVSDEARARYGVPPLETLLQQAPERPAAQPGAAR
jgi:hypothetical protein